MLHLGLNHPPADGHSDRLPSFATCKPANAGLLAHGSSHDGGGLLPQPRFPAEGVRSK